MTVRSIAAAFGDLTPGEWFHVATRVRRAEWNVWDWHLSDTDRDALILARDIGSTVATMQERTPDGGMRLVARLLPVRGVARNEKGYSIPLESNQCDNKRTANFA